MASYSRRDFIKLGTLGTAALPFMNADALSSEISERPNIIFIFVDDMGYGDPSCYGNSEIRTPNIDRLADEGIKFTNFYADSPICSPSRVAVTTGRYPARHRIHSFLASRQRNRKRGMTDYLDPDAPSLARTLKQGGYATAHFGKWHMGGGRDVEDAPLPRAYGFDETLVSFEGLGDRLLQKGHSLSEANARLGRGEITWVRKWEKTGIYTDRTLNFMEQHRDRPFYIQFWPGDVHDPHKPKSEWREKFREFDNDPYKRDFFAVLDNLDHQIGRILDKLDELGLSEQTLVLLTSDNGPTDWPRYYEEHYWPPGSSGPFRGRKWSLYEGGIRMPFLVRLPGSVPAGVTDTSTVMHSADLFPTLAALAGVNPPDADFDGENMSRALTGEALGRTRPLFWEYRRENFYLTPGNPRFVSPNLAVREGKWKLLINDDGSDIELYNLERDHAETENLAKVQPRLAERLSGKVLQWRRSLP